jgi:hypothetical protein
MELRCLTAGRLLRVRRLLLRLLMWLLMRRLLLRTRLLPLLRLALLLPAAVASLGTRTAIRAPIAALSLTLSIARLLAIASAIAGALLEAPLLLAIALLVAASVAAPTVSAPVLSTIAALLVTTMVPLALWLRICRGSRGSDRRRWRRLEEAEQTREETFCHLRDWLNDLLRNLLRRRRWCRLRGTRRPRQRVIHHRRGLRRRDGLHHGLLALKLGFGALDAGCFGFFGALDHLVAGRHVLHLVQLVVPQALHLVVRRIEVWVGHHDDVDLEPAFELLDFGPLFVQEERGDIDGDLRMHGARVFLHRLFLHDPQDVQGGRLGAADEAGA